MGVPARFINGGVSTVAVNKPLGNFGMPDPTQWITHFTDFTQGGHNFPIAASGLAAASTAYWTLTVTEAGAGDAATAVVAGNGGAVSLTNDAADNDLIAVQCKPASFTTFSGKRAFFKARFKVSDATQSDWMMGLYVVDTSPLAADGDGVTDGIFFQKDDGDTNLDFYVQKNTTTGQLTTTAWSTSAANDTWMTLAWAWDGKRYVSLYKDDVFIKAVDLGATISDYLPDTDLAVSFMIQNGEAVAKVMTIDYVFAALER